MKEVNVRLLEHAEHEHKFHLRRIPDCPLCEREAREASKRDDSFPKDKR